MGPAKKQWNPTNKRKGSRKFRDLQNKSSDRSKVRDAGLPRSKHLLRASTLSSPSTPRTVVTRSSLVEDTSSNDTDPPFLPSKTLTSPSTPTAPTTLQPSVSRPHQANISRSEAVAEDRVVESRIQSHNQRGSVRSIAHNSGMRGGKKRTVGTPSSPRSRKAHMLESAVSRLNVEGAATNSPVTPSSVREGSLNRRINADDHTQRREEAHLDDDAPITASFPDDTNTVTAIVNAAEKRIIRHINMLYKKMILEVKGNDSVITDLSKTMATLDTKVTNLSVLTSHNSSAVARLHPSRKKAVRLRGRTGKTSLEQEVEALHPTITTELNAVFSPFLFCRAAAYTISSYMDFFHKTQDDVRMTSRTLSVFLYGLMRNMSRTEFKVGVGRQHANFRFKIALNATRDALLITDDMFKRQEQQVLAELVREHDSGSDSSRIIHPSSAKPAWLSSRVLTRQIMDTARVYHEYVKSEHPSLPSGSMQRKAVHIGSFVVKSVNDMLRISRDRCKQKMFEAGIFLLTDWTKRDAFQDGHCNPHMRFLNPSSVPISPNDIEDCSTCSMEGYQMRNARILKNVIRCQDEMIVEATYAVTVVTQKSLRGRNEEPVTEIRDITRQFNILRIALVFMESYSQCKEEAVLSSHPSMMRNIYRLALMLREFFIEKLNADANGEGLTGSKSPEASATGGRDGKGLRNDGEGGRASSRPNFQSEHSRVGTGAVLPQAVLCDILPGDSETEKEIVKVLKMSLDVYEKVSVRLAGSSQDIKPDCDKGRSNGEQTPEEEIEFDFNSLNSGDEEVSGMFDE